MKKLNTIEIYQLAQVMPPVLGLTHAEGMTLKTIFLPVARLQLTLNRHLKAKDSLFSQSMKRAAGQVIRSIHGISDNEDIFETDVQKKVTDWDIDRLVQSVKDFETVLANELPGLATYIVSPKGIYSTDELISNAEIQIPESLRNELPVMASSDIREAGKCLGYDVPTASAFHMWRAVESVMDLYYTAISGKSFADNGVTRNWGAYIKALEEKKADPKITVFLDHIREEYRNPVSHPTITIDLDEAFGLFGVGISVISQMLKAIKQCPPKTLNALSRYAQLAGVKVATEDAGGS